MAIQTGPRVASWFSATSNKFNTNQMKSTLQCFPKFNFELSCPSQFNTSECSAKVMSRMPSVMEFSPMMNVWLSDPPKVVHTPLLTLCGVSRRPYMVLSDHLSTSSTISVHVSSQLASIIVQTTLVYFKVIFYLPILPFMLVCMWMTSVSLVSPMKLNSSLSLSSTSISQSPMRTHWTGS